MSRGVGIYFAALFGLTLIALIPDTITIGMLLFFVPGLILVASSTLLYYSVALLPAYFINRFFRMRLLAAAVGAVCVAAAALLPHYVNEQQLRSFVASDHADPPTLSPRSFELPYPGANNDWTNGRRAETRRTTAPAPCIDLCQQLLFRGHVDQVVVRDPSELGAMVVTREGTTDHVLFKPMWRRFRLQQRESCPDTLSLLAGEFVHDVADGRCLIEDVVDRSDADVALSIFESPVAVAVRYRREDRPSRALALRRIETGPTTVTITERRDGRAIPVEVRTTLVANYAKVPFYLSVKRCGGAEIPDLCLAVASDPFPGSTADPFEMISRRYGLQIAPTPWRDRLTVPVSDGDRIRVEAILKHDYGKEESIPWTQERLVLGFVNARLKSAELNPDDLELMRALLKQRAFTAAIESRLPPSSFQALKPLLPEMFERIAYRADGQSEIVRSLNVILGHFPAEDTDSYSAALCQERKNADLEVCYRREFRNARKR